MIHQHLREYLSLNTCHSTTSSCLSLLQILNCSKSTKRTKRPPKRKFDASKADDVCARDQITDLLEQNKKLQYFTDDCTEYIMQLYDINDTIDWHLTLTNIKFRFCGILQIFLYNICKPR